MGVRVVEVVEVVHHAFNGYGTHLSLPDEDLLGKFAYSLQIYPGSTLYLNGGSWLDPPVSTGTGCRGQSGILSKHCPPHRESHGPER